MEDIKELMVDGNDIITEITEVKKTYIIHLDEEIGDTKLYRDLFDCCLQASTDDTIKLIINTAGGNLDTTNQIIDYLLRTKAKTTCDVYQACSAGSAIMLACDEIDIRPFGYVMVHSLSSGTIGKMNEIESYSKSLSKRGKDQLYKIYSGFLSREEIEEVSKGVDLWIDEEEARRRLTDRTLMRRK